MPCFLSYREIVYGLLTTVTMHFLLVQVIACVTVIVPMLSVNLVLH